MQPRPRSETRGPDVPRVLAMVLARRPHAHRRAHLRNRRGGDRTRALGSLAQRLLERRLVGPQRQVALANWRQPLDDRLAHGFLERAVALARELALDLIRRDLTRHGHHLDQVRDPLLAGAPDDVRAGVGLGALNLPADRVGLVVDVDQACVAAVARGHLGRGVLEVHNPGPDLRNDGPRLDEHVRIARVEAPRDLTRQLDVLALVFPYRHLVGLVEQDVGGLEHWVEEQAGAHELLLARRLVLELVHALQVAVGGDRAQQPGQLRVLVKVGLAEEDAASGIEPGGDHHGRGVEHVLRQGLGVVGDARGVQVDDAVDRRIAAFLTGQVAPDRADVVAHVLAARGLDAAEDAHGGEQSTKDPPPSPARARPRCSRSPSGSTAGRAAEWCPPPPWRASRAPARPPPPPRRGASRARLPPRAAGATPRRRRWRRPRGGARRARPPPPP